MSVNRTVDVGPVTAYAAAKSAGYTGTYEEFCEEQAHFAENAQQVAEDKETTRGYMNTTEGYKNEANQAKLDAQTAKQGSETAASQSAGYRDAARGYADAAQDSAEAIEDLTVLAETLPAGSQASVTKTGGGSSPYNLKFGIPKGDKGDKGNILFASFYVDADGILNAVYDNEYTGPTFRISNKGVLEVVVG